MSNPSSAPDLRISVPGIQERAYPLFFGRGMFERLGELIAAELVADHCAVVADARVAALYGEAAVDRLKAAGLSARLFTFPEGEAHKSRVTWSDLTDRLLASGLGRDGFVVALGGGVTGDLAGLVASTYMRGVPLVMVPTSVTAMLDSAVGGKTGVDTPAGKNLVGTFHQPRLVLIDPELLTTLAPEHRHAGLAEGVKTAAIRDAALFGWIEERATKLRDGDTEALEHLVKRSVTLKAQVVATDPEEAGLRQILNFGHTVGHALEALSGYAILHGEAVATGMRIESRLGETLGVTERGTAARLADVLERCGLSEARIVEQAASASTGWFDAERLLTAASADKKVRGGKVRWVLLERIGAVAPDSRGAWTHGLDEDAALAALRAAFPAEADVRDSAS